jgi:DNA excision repair protein ERCC-2
LQPLFSVSVRALIEFVLRRGDLGTDRDFVTRDRALAGTRGHQQIQRSRPPGYQKEVGLSFDCDAGEFILRVQGRIDGVLETQDEVILEEIKTVHRAWDGTPDSLHWAQAKCYGFIFAHQRALRQITLRLTYLNLDTGRTTELIERFTTAELAAFFEQTVAVYLAWVRLYWRHSQERNESLARVPFPFAAYRPGQRQLAVAAYRAIARGERLFVEAPTGSGKTMAVIFPAVKALGEGKIERIFYLTARTTGRAIAENALSQLTDAGVQLRSLTLTAREKVCLQNGQPCDRASCPLARGYYDRRHPAMRQALTHFQLQRTVLESLAREHQVCPFELALDLSRWVDVIIGDFNHVFDPRAYLRRHFDDESAAYALLIDEAHNLVDRAREMFSAELSCAEIREVRRAIQSTVPGCAKALGRLNSAITKLARRDSDAPELPGEEGSLGLFDPQRQGLEAPPPLPSIASRGFASRDRSVLCLPELPASLTPGLEQALDQAEAWLAQNQPSEFRASLLQLYFRLYAFYRTMGSYDERYRTLVEPGRFGAVRLFCLDPSLQLSQALERGNSAVFFSATLTPLVYYREVLGGKAQDRTLGLDSPFPPENLLVLVHDGIRTDWKARTATLLGVAQAIGAAVQEKRGNYLVYLPSYEYLAALHGQFVQAFPGCSVLVQRPGMSDLERGEFLAAFATDHDETRVGFAVLGGIFGEAIDLVGERLIGAIIVGVGLPQLCLERDLIRNFFEERTHAGFDYAYTFPGMNRVRQAVGRVIRSESDRGMVLLIDTRFGRAQYRSLFPSWWRPLRVSNVSDLGKALRLFWDPLA